MQILKINILNEILLILLLIIIFINFTMIT
jgi:hypothetical protein